MKVCRNVVPSLAFIAGVLLAAIAPTRVLAAAPSSAATFKIDAVTTNAAPKIDGTLDDPAWQSAAHSRLDWDYSFQRPASEPTDVYLLVDSRYIYVAFVARQREPITATLRTNNVTLAADDVVRIYLWPGGDRGFEYIFGSTPIGTRNQVSTENSAFTPTWTVVGKRTASGYTVTMQIPLRVMRGDGRKTWRLQFDRHITATNQTLEWSHSGSQSSTDDINAIGTLDGMIGVARSTRTKPRLGVYALGQAGAQRVGGTRARMGADFSFPISPTASFFGTVYPDYSNVEQDQQTISPTAFPRQFNEVRPFFTQGGNFYNNLNCNDCVNFPLLYTPHIPTPRSGFAAEGVQGQLQFATFSALGQQRTDSAQWLRYSTPDNRYSVRLQRESVTLPGFIDDMFVGQYTIGNAHNFSVYGTLGYERGTGITDPSLANMSEFGINLYTPRSGIFAAYHHNGALFAPVDAFVFLTDVNGPSVFAHKEWDFSPTSLVQSVNVGDDYQRFENRFGMLDYAFHGPFVNVTLRDKLSLSAQTGNQFLLLPDGTGVSINQNNGASISYGANTSQPSSIAYAMGRWDVGYLDTAVRSTTFKAGERGTVTLEADDTDYRPDTGPRLVQWLERVSFAYHIGPDASLALGARRIIGIAPPLTPPPENVNASNLTLAYYQKLPHDEIYLAYGDPSKLATKPALVLKFIHYIGAEKGT